MRITLVVAASENDVIGRDGDLPWRLPADLAHFKRVTIGKPIVMGRKTFESIGKPLSGRRNIVVTASTDYRAEGCIVVHTIQEALSACHEAEEAMVIGGESLYR